MSELAQYNTRNFRWQLLITVSALALSGSIYAADIARASDDDHPTVWLELGGLLDRVGEHRDPYLPDFTAVGVEQGLMGARGLQETPRFASGGQVAISFKPEAVAWDFSVALRYGRSNANRHRHQQSTVPVVYLPSGYPLPLQGKNHNQTVAQTADYAARIGESHTIIDFVSGRDIGIGRHSSLSHIGFGVRFAQFTENSNVKLLADPDPHFGSKYVPPLHTSAPILRYYQSYKARAEIKHSFNGIGPSVVWTGSALLEGTNSDRAGLTIDWGINASLLIGRQKAHIHHQTTGAAYKAYFFGTPAHVDHYTNVVNLNRTRSLVVPNVGALAGLSFRFPNAKVSLGYRADFFFGAMDAGIDTRHTADMSYHGPFASISVGLGG
jgi:hypothetical protein